MSEDTHPNFGQVFRSNPEEKKVTEADLPKNIDFTGLLRMKYTAYCSLHSRAPVNMHYGRLCG